MDNTTTAFTTALTAALTIGLPVATLFYKVGEFYIVRQRERGAQSLAQLAHDALTRQQQIAKDAEVKIEEMKIQASLRTQQEVMQAVGRIENRSRQLDDKFNSLIDYLVKEPELRDKLRRNE